MNHQPTDSSSQAQATFETSIESLLQSSLTIPIWFWILFGISTLGLCLWLYWTERGTAGSTMRLILALLRFSLFMLVIWMLGGWSWIRYKTEQPELVVVLDRSSSMATRDQPSPDDESSVQSRWEVTAQILANTTARQAQQLSDQYQISFFTIAESLTTTQQLFDETKLSQLSPEGGQSRLGDGLTRLIERQTGRGTAAIVFISDGINTAGDSLASVSTAARLAAIPIHSVLVGRENAQPDVRLVDFLIDRDVYFGDRVMAEVSVVASDIDESPITVTLSDEKSGQIMDETILTLSADRNQKVATLSFVPEVAGEMSLRVSTSSVIGETDLDNNIIRQSITIQDKTLKVLFVQDAPSYEFRFLKHLLERLRQAGQSTTASFELMSVLQESDAEYVSQDASAIRLVPNRIDEINEIDVFIFGQFDPELVSQKSQEAIYSAITESGAGCIFIDGSGDPARKLQAWPLGRLLPIRFNATADRLPIDGPWHWSPTTIGQSALPMQLATTPQQSLKIWQSLPPLQTTCAVGELKLGAQVLAETSGTRAQLARPIPLLITQYAGAGRVALQTTDETYRWTSFQGKDTYHQRYWGQLLRWLSRGKLNRVIDSSQLRVEPQKSKFQQAIRIEAEIGSEVAESDLPESARVIITRNGEQVQTLSLNPSQRVPRIYSDSISDLPPGQYRAVLFQPSTNNPPSQEFSVTSPPGEQANLKADAEAMRSLAKQSRGQFYSVENADKLFEELPRGKPTRLGTLPPSPLWNTWWIATLFVTIITAEWLLRRKVRML